MLTSTAETCQFMLLSVRGLVMWSRHMTSTCGQDVFSLTMLVPLKESACVSRPPELVLNKPDEVPRVVRPCPIDGVALWDVGLAWC